MDAPPPPTVTFVSAFLDLREDRSNDKSVDRCFSLFERLAASHLSICLFVSPSLYDRAAVLRAQYPTTLYVMPSTELEDLWTHRTVSSIAEVSLPEERTSYHDTTAFLTLMNAKIEFVAKAMKSNPFGTSHFAWIDFSICHVLRQAEQTLERLHTYSVSRLQDRMLLFPACWSKSDTKRRYATLLSRVHWRFCGGFFIGDRQSLWEFYRLYQTHFPAFLREKKRLLWEVNFWAFLEQQGYLVAQTYRANHDDSILHIPAEYLQTVACLTTIPPRFQRVLATVRSLLSQVDHVYLSVSRNYERFGTVPLLDISNEADLQGRVSIVECEDRGPATKYVGALTHLSKQVWVLFCDDDQCYHPSLVRKMKRGIRGLGAYQNAYHHVKKGSGGIIHGYVGNLFHQHALQALSSFPQPACSRFVDDQWMSVYCFQQKIPIYPSGIETYTEIFSVLRKGGYELVGEESLAALGNRDQKVEELANYFRVLFCSDGVITSA